MVVLLRVMLTRPEPDSTHVPATGDHVITSAPRYPPFDSTHSTGRSSVFAIDAMNHIAARAGPCVACRNLRQTACDPLAGRGEAFVPYQPLVGRMPRDIAVLDPRDVPYGHGADDSGHGG